MIFIDLVLLVLFCYILCFFFRNYIPFYTLSWLFGEKYKAFIISCTGVEDDRTADEPEAVSPRRESARESMLKR
uniref:Uncharacterized protein n=1 Tax=Angiostrongylus cantonensis TaxID=6313 RepID=A0A0K0DCU8_ANGCA